MLFYKIILLKKKEKYMIRYEDVNTNKLSRQKMLPFTFSVISWCELWIFDVELLVVVEELFSPPIEVVVESDQPVRWV